MVHVAETAAGRISTEFSTASRSTITAYLFTPAATMIPSASEPTREELSQAAMYLGMGFTFDDQPTDGVANPISEMQRLIERNPRNAERIFPYIGGEEVN